MPNFINRCVKKHRKARLDLDQGNVAAVNVVEPTLNVVQVFAEEMSLHGRPLPLPPHQEGGIPSDNNRGSINRDNNRQQVLNNNGLRNDADQFIRNPTVLRVNPAYNSRPGGEDDDSLEGGRESYDYPRMVERDAAVTDGTGGA